MRAQVAKYSDGMRSQKYICWTRKQMRYMLGDHGFSYVVGFNQKFPLRPADRGASCPRAPANCTQVTALYNPQPNPHTLYGALVQAGPWLLPANILHDMPKNLVCMHFHACLDALTVWTRPGACAVI